MLSKSQEFLWLFITFKYPTYGVVSGNDYDDNNDVKLNDVLTHEDQLCQKGD